MKTPSAREAVPLAIIMFRALEQLDIENAHTHKQMFATYHLSV